MRQHLSFGTPEPRSNTVFNDSDDNCSDAKMLECHAEVLPLSLVILPQLYMSGNVT